MNIRGTFATTLLGLFLASPAMAAKGIVEVVPTALGPANQRMVAITDINVLQNSGVDFSFARTIGQIITTAGVPSGNTAANRIAVVNSMINTFKKTQATNSVSRIVFPLTPRPGEAALKAADLLNPASPDGMRPVGVFNRLDLAPADWSTCGEYRIVYEKGAPVSFTNRMTIIFEAVVDNPAPGHAAGCMKIAQFWANLKNISSPIILAQMLETFFYFTVDGANGPAVQFKNYGTPFGQVRANLFVNHPGGLWQLREWLLTQTPAGSVQFKMNPVRNTAFTPLFAQNGFNDTPALQTLRTKFQNDFKNIYIKQLTAVDLFNNGANVGEKNFIYRLGYNLDIKYSGFESTSTQSSDDPVQAGTGNFLYSLDVDNALNALQLPWTVTSLEVFGRAAIQGCEGCHNFTPPTDIAPSTTGGRVIPWPNSQPFTHIDENGNISDLLRLWFLPSRFTNLTNYIANPPLNNVSATTTVNSVIDTRKALSLVSMTVDHQAQLATVDVKVDATRAQERNLPGAFVPIRPAD